MILILKRIKVDINFCFNFMIIFLRNKKGNAFTVIFFFSYLFAISSNSLCNFTYWIWVSDVPPSEILIHSNFEYWSNLFLNFSIVQVIWYMNSLLKNLTFNCDWNYHPESQLTNQNLHQDIFEISIRLFVKKIWDFHQYSNLWNIQIFFL